METIYQAEIDNFAGLLGYSTDELMRESLLEFVWRNLQEVKTEILRIQKKYNVGTPEDFESAYEKGLVQEENSIKDYRKFDHLFYKEEVLENFLKQLA
jgi:hypothetical protein